MEDEYTHEEILRGILGNKSLSDLMGMVLVEISKLKLRLEKIEKNLVHKEPEDEI